MNGVFEVRPLVEPGFLRRLFKRTNPENGYIELGNLLATERWTALHEGHVESVLRKHGARSVSRKKAKALYTKAVKACAADDQLTTEEIEDLQRLRNLLGIREMEAQEIEQQIVHPKYQQAVSEVLRDQHVTVDEREGLVRLRKALRVDERTALKMWEENAEPILSRKWQTAVNDRRLSPDEQQALEAMARNFGITVEIDSATRTHLDRFRWFWQMENGTFPEVSVPIALQKKEVCHFAAATMLHEMRTETQRINYGGPAVSFRIMKGVYYRAGSMRVERVTRDVLRAIDSGTIYITNKRIIFDGSRKNTTVRLSNILAITPYTDAIEIEKTSGRNPIFTLDDPEWVSVLLSSLLAEQGD